MVPSFLLLVLVLNALTNTTADFLVGKHKYQASYSKLIDAMAKVRRTENDGHGLLRENGIQYVDENFAKRDKEISRPTSEEFIHSGWTVKGKRNMKQKKSRQL